MQNLLSSLSEKFTMEYTTGFATLLAVMALLWRMQRSRRRLSPPLPPGPPGLPLVGNLLSLSPPLHIHFTKFIGIYGPIFRIWFGQKLCVVISNPALAREALVDNEVAMANHDVSAAARIIKYHGNVVFTPMGGVWSMLRGVMVRELLNPDSLDALYGVRRREVRTAVAYLGASVGKEVDLGTLMFVTVVNSILSVAGAESMHGEERMRVGKELRELVGEITKLFGTPNVSDFFPALERFDLQGLQRKMGELMEPMDRFLTSIVDKKKKQRQMQGGSKKDLLDHVLDLEQKGGDSETPFTMAHLKGILLSMVVGGGDTTSSTLEWAMTEILWNPEIMRRAQKELDQVVGKDSIVEGSHLPELRYVMSVVKETLRLHPVSPFLVPHTPSKSCIVGGYTVPKGSMIFLNVWAIQRDPSLWKDPLKFNPDRFLDSDGNLELKGNDFSYFPLGSGSRTCVGVPLAERMTVHILASILHSFDLTMSEGTKPDLSEKDGLIVKKRTPLVVVPTPRLQKPEQYS